VINKETKYLPRFMFVAKPFKSPPEPPLPVERMNECPPFEYVGVDFFGQFRVRRGAETRKMYGVILQKLIYTLTQLEEILGEFKI
jgi:hypothetical protein